MTSHQAIPKPPFRKTKIVATIGPACDDLETLKQMIAAGMNVARLNLSFGAGQDQQERVARIRAAAEAMHASVAIMADTRGIEIRTGRLDGPSAELSRDRPFVIYGDGRMGDCNGMATSYAKLYSEVAPGVPILLDDGAIELEVLSVQGAAIHCRVVHGGVLRANKGVNLPETQLSISAVSPENREDVIREMTFAAENQIEYVAASFVQTAEDIGKMREILLEKGVKIPIIAKIENKAGVRNLEEIVQAADGIMVARGDLGVELPLADVPGMQKKMIRTTVSSGKPVITATQMLASMENNPKPTRAEASDVANAILDGTSAVMLSGETAMGRFPVLAVQTMAVLAVRTEESLAEYGYLQKAKPNRDKKVTEAVSQAAITMADHLQAAAILSLTSSGFTSRQISKYRPSSPILAVTESAEVARQLALNWGVAALRYTGALDDEQKTALAIEHARGLGLVGAGDVVVITASHDQKAGGTDSIRVKILD